jgi:hypothetical protein
MSWGSPSLAKVGFPFPTEQVRRPHFARIFSNAYGPTSSRAYFFSSSAKLVAICR